MILALGFLCAFTMTSCAGHDEQQETKPDQIGTVDVQETAPDVKTVTGVAVDGAMNSVYLKVGDDTLDYSFPDLESENRASWDINDTLTIKYVVTEYGDSVIEVINECA